MDSRSAFRDALDHKPGNTFPVDFGATPVTGIHARIIEQLRQHFGLEGRPVKVTEPYQMLGEIEDDLLEELGVDVIGMRFTIVSACYN